jgi:hypothetical protein
MVFNATLNNISVVSWRSVLLMEETGVPGNRGLYHSSNIRGRRGRVRMVIGFTTNCAISTYHH